MDIKVIRTAFATVKDAIGKNKDRPALSQVLVEVEPSTLRLVATNGHTLCLTEVYGETWACTSRFTLPMASYKMLTAVLKTTRAVDCPVLDGGVVEWCGAKIATGDIDAFPPWREVMPKGKAERAATEVGLDPALLAKACAAVALTGSKASPVTALLQVRGELDPIEISGGTDAIHVRYIVMPRRI